MGTFSGITAGNVTTVSTYSSIGIEINAGSGAGLANPPTTSNTNGRWGGCRLQYRVSGVGSYKDAIDLPYDQGGTRGGVSLPAQYRGSLLLCNAGTTYDLKVTHDDGTSYTFTASTRTDVANLPVAQTITLPALTQSIYNANTGGTAGGYVLYTGAPGVTPVIDAGHIRNYCMRVGSTGSAVEYVIFRNIKFTGAVLHCVLLGSTDSSNSQTLTNIIFDNCEFTDWGSPPPAFPNSPYCDNLLSAIFCLSSNLQNVTVQRCHIHDPAMGSNTWYVDEGDNPAVSGTTTQHPEGPQAFSLRDSKGGHVIRYNTIEASVSNHFNDSMGDTSNFSDGGYPCQNTDIHHNIIRYTWDDGIEIEGRDKNIRIWNNIFDEVYHGIGLAPVLRGPVYIWGNVGRISKSGTKRDRGQNFLKWRRTQSSGGTDYSGGHVFFFNNTTLPRVSSTSQGFKQLYAEEEALDSIRNWHVWNNVINNDGTAVAFEDPNGTNNEIRNNLFKFGWTTSSEPSALVSGNIDNRPTYATNTWNATTGVGVFLQTSGAGYQAGIAVPNVFDGVTNPDCGAMQHTQSEMRFGHLNMPATVSTVTPTNAAQAQTAASPAVTVRTAVAANASQGHSSTSPSVIVPAVTANNSAQTQAATSPTVSVVTIAPANAAEGHTASSPNIAAKSSIVPVNCSQAHSPTSPTLTVRNVVTANDATEGHVATGPGISVTPLIGVDVARQSQASSDSTILAYFNVAADNAAMTHAASQPIVLAGTIQVSDCAQDNSAGAILIQVPVTAARHTRRGWNKQTSSGSWGFGSSGGGGSWGPSTRGR
jgi:hypothetical protein